MFVVSTAVKGKSFMEILSFSPPIAKCNMPPAIATASDAAAAAAAAAPQSVNCI